MILGKRKNRGSKGKSGATGGDRKMALEEIRRASMTALQGTKYQETLQPWAEAIRNAHALLRLVKPEASVMVLRQWLHASDHLSDADVTLARVDFDRAVDHLDSLREKEGKPRPRAKSHVKTNAAALARVAEGMTDAALTEQVHSHEYLFRSCEGKAGMGRRCAEIKRDLKVLKAEHDKRKKNAAKTPKAPKAKRTRKAKEPKAAKKKPKAEKKPRKPRAKKAEL